MRIADLISYGLPQGMIDRLLADGLEYLLPIQQEAIKQYDLLAGKDLLICGPTSSGKTLCGELAALNAINRNKKAVILAPLKAIAFEKYNQFRKRYHKLNLKLLIVSSDYPENKEKFKKGEYDLAIVVYEMFNSLTAANLAPLDTIGAMIFDEFQLITSGDRGLILESILAKTRYFGDKIQIVSLIGGLTDCRLFERWLNIPLLTATNRPVELHRGTLLDKRFSYCRFNDCHEGVEYFSPNDNGNNSDYDYDDISGELRNALNYLIQNDEQALVFVARRNHSNQLAIALAQTLDLPTADHTIDTLADMPDTVQKASLVECLRRGVAFHNADLSLGYREALEDGYRSGEIKIMVCTSTLAMGVNLPSRNVFIEPEKYYDSVTGQAVLKPLQVDDYNQIAGRAGRLGLADDFGRAVIIARDDHECEKIREHYFNRSSGVHIDLFDNEKLAKLVLCWISCGLIKDYNDTKDMLKASLRGYTEGFENIVPTRIIDFLNMHGFITLKGCRLICTDLGRAAVSHNLELNTAAAIKDGFIRYKLENRYLSWVYYMMEIPECSRQKLTGRHYNYEDPVIEYVKSLPGLFDEVLIGPLKLLIDNPDNGCDPSRVCTLMLLADMIQPMPTIELETKYHTGWGRLKRLGEFYANLLLATAEIGQANGLTKAQADYLKKFAERLYHGLPESGLALARLHIRFLERDFILRLIGAGLATPADIAAADFDMLTAIIPEKLAHRLYRKCSKIITTTDNPQQPSIAKTKPPLLSKRIGQRYEVAIAGHIINLQPRLYKYLHKLYNADHPEGWVDKNLLDSGLNQVKYIYKLRKELEIIEGIEIETDGAGRYRMIPRDFSSIPQCADISAGIG